MLIQRLSGWLKQWDKLDVVDGILYRVTRDARQRFFWSDMETDIKE